MLKCGEMSFPIAIKIIDVNKIYNELLQIEENKNQIDYNKSLILHQT
jgi:hypothetical protein